MRDVTLNFFDFRHDVFAIGPLAAPELRCVDSFSMRDQKAAMVGAGRIALNLNAAVFLSSQDAEYRSE
jgi:hypothetical protein